MIVDCAHYRDGRRQHEGPMPPEEAAAICRQERGFVWLGVVEPTPEELVRLQEIFGLHELAVEDAQSYHLRPKIEHYDEDDVTFGAGVKVVGDVVVQGTDRIGDGEVLS